MDIPNFHVKVILPATHGPISLGFIIIRARCAPLSPASGFPVSIFPSFPYSIGINLHPSGLNSRPGPLGPDSLHLFRASDLQGPQPLTWKLGSIIQSFFYGARDPLHVRDVHHLSAEIGSNHVVVGYPLNRGFQEKQSLIIDFVWRHQASIRARPWPAKIIHLSGHNPGKICCYGRPSHEFITKIRS